MKRVLVDTSGWISFFRGEPQSKPLKELIEYNLLCTNNLILAELIPSLLARNEREVVSLLESIYLLDLNINWKEIVTFQVKNLQNGVNKVGIPDLIILQNALQYRVPIFTLDKHFREMAALFPVTLYTI